MKENERLTIALPSGELQEDVIGFMKNIGLDFTVIDRRLLIKVDNMPIDFVILRASDIPQRVEDKRTKAKAGITGSDIIWNAGMGKDFGEDIPINELNSQSKKSSLYIGVTNNFYRYILNHSARDPQIKDLSSCMVVTKYPRISQEVFAERQADNVEIFPVAGTDEAMQYILPCDGILGIISSGKTIAANDIKILEIFYQVTIKMIKSPNKLTNRDCMLLDDFRERIAIAIQRKRMI